MPFKTVIFMMHAAVVGIHVAFEVVVEMKHVGEMLEA